MSVMNQNYIHNKIMTRLNAKILAKIQVIIYYIQLKKNYRHWKRHLELQFHLLLPNDMKLGLSYSKGRTQLENIWGQTPEKERVLGG
jgi:hypothetical protein